jgi:hypothetical protein
MAKAKASAMAKIMAAMAANQRWRKKRKYRKPEKLAKEISAWQRKRLSISESNIIKIWHETNESEEI